MPAAPHIRSSMEKGAATVLVELLNPSEWIPAGKRAVAPDFPNLSSTLIRVPGISWCKRRNIPRETWCLFKQEQAPKKFCAFAKNRLTRFGNPCDVAWRSSGVIESPRNENKDKNKGKKHEC